MTKLQQKATDEIILELLNPRGWPRQTRITIILIVCILSLIALVSLPRIPLGAGYHDFADERTLLGVPNALNVLSNLPFFVVGVYGLLWLLAKQSKSAFLDKRERLPYLIFFAGVALTGIGSFWYHLQPSNSRLPWDLLPMTCSFMSMVVATFMERVNIRMGFLALPPLLLLGIASVVYWYVSEAQGRGDYKFYLFVQFFSPVVLAMLVVLFPARYSGLAYLAVAFMLFVVAKLFELFDRQIYSLGSAVSGHSLKHVTAAVSCYYILRMLQTRHASVDRRLDQHGRWHESEKVTLFR